MRKIILIAAAAALLFSCNTAVEEGKPFEELPVIQKSDLLAFFKALPKGDLPARIETAEARETYFNNFLVMSEDSCMADGEGPIDELRRTDNAIFYSDYICFDEDSIPEAEDGVHPYVNIYLYASVHEGRYFGIVKSGSYTEGEDGPKSNPDKYYWFDSASGKLKATKLPLTPAYTVDDLTADPLLTFGAANLYYAIKNKCFSNQFFDRGFAVYIDDIGESGVAYDWDGAKFVRNSTRPIRCIYNYGFANIYMGRKVPYDIPGYSTTMLKVEEMSYVYSVVKSGEEEPVLFLQADNEEGIFMIEVCSDRYANPYGIYPGMPFADFLAVIDKVNSLFPEPTYISYDESDPDFVNIYVGFDEDFIYKVSKSYYLGGEQFSKDAVLARVAILNAVG